MHREHTISVKNMLFGCLFWMAMFVKDITFISTLYLAITSDINFVCSWEVFTAWGWVPRKWKIPFSHHPLKNWIKWDSASHRIYWNKEIIQLLRTYSSVQRIHFFFMRPGASVTVLCSFCTRKSKYKESYNQQATSCCLLTLNTRYLVYWNK